LVREQAARAAAEEATKRFRFLADATTALAKSLDVETTLHGLLKLAVPRLGDWAAVMLAGEDGRPGQTEVAGVPDPPNGGARLADWHRPLADAVARVLDGQAAEHLPDLPADPRGHVPARAAAILPLVARGR